MPSLSSLTKLFGEAKNLKNAAKVAGYERELTGAVVGGLGGSLFGAVSNISEEERKEGDTRLGRIASYGMMGALGGAAIGAVSKMRAGAEAGLKVSSVKANSPVVHTPTPPVAPPPPPVVAPPVPKPPPVKPTGPAVNLNNGPSTVIKTPPPTPPPVVPPNTPATNVPVNPSPVTSKPVVDTTPPVKSQDILPEPDYFSKIKQDASARSATNPPETISDVKADIKRMNEGLKNKKLAEEAERVKSEQVSKERGEAISAEEKFKSKFTDTLLNNHMNGEDFSDAFRDQYLHGLEKGYLDDMFSDSPDVKLSDLVRREFNTGKSLPKNMQTVKDALIKHRGDGLIPFAPKKGEIYNPLTMIGSESGGTVSGLLDHGLKDSKGRIVTRPNVLLDSPKPAPAAPVNNVKEPVPEPKPAPKEPTPVKS